MKCAKCEEESAIRFCSLECLVAFSKAQTGVECAQCQWDPVRGRPGNLTTHRLCPACSESPENRDWCAPSDLEQVNEDVDVAILVAGGARFESVFGGARKMDTGTAALVVQCARRRVIRRRRRRNANGHPLRGWEEYETGMTLREIAAEVGCSVGYAHKVIARLLG